MLLLHRFPRLAFASALSVAVVYCSGGEDIIVPPPPGTLEITTSTSGVEPDADGYSVQIDGAGSQGIGSGATLSIPDVPPGNHTVELADMASNCTISSPNPQGIRVAAGETATVTFAIVCGATTGGLTITAATSGPSPDPDGYAVSIDGTDRGTLGLSAAVTISRLVPGSHAVGLSGVAANCRIQGENIRTVTITAGTDASVAYTIICETPPPGTGSLRVITTTSGPDADADGYTLAVDGGAVQPIGANAPATLTNLVAGSHSVVLSGVAGNCTVDGGNSRSVAVVGGATTDLHFAIACVAITGTIRVSVATSGSPPDPNGYVAKLDGHDPGLPLAPSGDATFTRVSAGTHTVALTGVATNCSVTGDASQSTTVAAGATAQLSFSVTCTATASRLEKVSGDPQTGRVSTVLGAPLVVKVTSAAGAPVQGVTISWSITGGGSVSEASTQTGANGQASVTRTLGGTAGPQTTLATAADLAGSPVTFTHTATAASSTGVGRWDPAFTTPVVAVHAHVLQTGKVLLWGDQGDAQLWDGNGFTPVTKTSRIYCSAHTFLPDGRLMVVGGTSPNTRGLRSATVFDPVSSSWSNTSSMAQGRYYATTTALASGEVLAVSGHDTTLSVVTIPEVWNGSGWRRLTTAPLSIPDPFYPAMFVAPNGKVFMAGFPETSQYLDVTGTGQWTTVAKRRVADRTMGSAVMYAPGKILYAGGGDPPTASAEVIDLNQPSPSWRTVPGMAFARRQMNATLLADGSVLVTGGTSGPGFNNQTGAVRAAELWNPRTETWTTMPPETARRTYHGTAVLLPSGQVLSSGSGEGGGITYANSEFSAQIFNPPYLLNADGSLAARPSITSAPSTLSHGQPFTVQTPDAGSITRGTLIRLSSVTHTFNMSQLLYELAITTTSTEVRATAPPNANLAPPGPYMLFLINGSGVPSEARMVTVGP
ncbi:MAG TPA: galactose oxidase-like domain-containing protein [Gemmatimonadales bacterium]|nr:galactose oxidase-like domain-containing protein [Gemmatimonadales bacterium]